MSYVYYIVIAVMVLGMGGYAYYRYYRPGAKRPADEAAAPGDAGARSNERTVYCRIADDTTGNIRYEYITPKQLQSIIDEYGTVGRIRQREGKKVYGFVRKAVLLTADEIKAAAAVATAAGAAAPEGTPAKTRIILKPILEPRDITDGPGLLHFHMQQRPLGIIGEELNRDDEKNFLEKHWQLLIWIGVMFFLAFIWTQS